MSTLQERFSGVEPWTVSNEERNQEAARQAQNEREQLVRDFQEVRERYFLVCDVANDPSVSPNKRALARRRRRTYGRKYHKLKHQLRAHGLLDQALTQRRRLI